MDNFSVYGSSFDHCVSNLARVLETCEETNLVLNFEKCHFTLPLKLSTHVIIIIMSKFFMKLFFKI